MPGNSNSAMLPMATVTPLRGWHAWLLCLLVLPGCFFVRGDLDPFSRRPKPLEERVVTGEGRAKIVLTDVSRVISNADEEGAFGILRRESVVGRIEAELEQAARDEDVAAVIVRINSPGGTVTASDIVYQRLMRFKAEHDVPVLAQLMDIATSGGYYVALAADEIVAHPTTVTGSVGVIFHNISVAGLLGKIGVADQTVKTGSKKDIGSPLRDMTGEERQLLEGILGDMQARFLGLVRERRPQVTDESAPVIADGRIVSAAQAHALGLVDRIGTLEETIDLAKQRAGVAEARVVMYRRPDEYAESIYARAAAPTIQLLNVDLGLLDPGPQFLYLWAPGLAAR